MAEKYRTRQEMIAYFRELALDFYKRGGISHNDYYLGKAEAYEIAAFELEQNMED